MEMRVLGRTGRRVGVVGLGAWQLGADWGEVEEDQALRVLSAAADAGVTFIDTADVYGDGRSEQLIGRFLKAGGAGITVATKMGRRVPQRPENYTLDAFREWTDRSRKNLGVDRLDLVQLHCPPTPVYSTDAVFDALDTLVEEGRIAAYGVSVETRAEALTAIARPEVATVQIILNMFRLGPLQEVLPATGLEAVQRLAPLVPTGSTMAQFALRWIIDQPGVSVVIPGARTPDQARTNATAATRPPLTSEALEAITEVYDDLIAPQVADRW
ncbi:aldo/keto reductase [Actinomadura latina]|uniref:Aldo/keto reductase n=1 Tax=Actinomadura latina TaxID=163603 RepID=A0A846YPW1_9ACTN|nr:aldo/keto reductase [Actinomadura latina]NKZ02201.1 aldo/keto reductase [Actinomadura latina]